MLSRRTPTRGTRYVYAHVLAGKVATFYSPPVVIELHSSFPSLIYVEVGLYTDGRPPDHMLAPLPATAENVITVRCRHIWLFAPTDDGVWL